MLKMAPLNVLLISLPVLIVFGIILWLMIFLNTYRHFPKMDSEERLWLCIVNATSLTGILIGIVYLFLWFILASFPK